MAKLKIIYPVIVFESIEVDVTEEKEEEIFSMNLKQKSEYINQLNEQKDLPDLTYPKLIEDALDTDYATIKRVKE